MKVALKGVKQRRWKVPRGLINVTLDAETGMPPDQYTLETITEPLTAAQIPTETEIQEYMAAHQEDFLERQTGVILNNADPAVRQRYEDKFRREQAQREANHRRRLMATQRENERRRNQGIPLLPLPTLAQPNMAAPNNMTAPNTEMPEQLF